MLFCLTNAAGRVRKRAACPPAFFRGEDRAVRRGVLGATLVLLLVFAAGGRGEAARAQTAPSHPLLVETAPSERLLREARRHLFDFRMGAAERTLAQLSARPDGAVAAHHHRALAALLKGLVTDDARHFDAFFEHSDAAESALSGAPDGPWQDYLWAETALLRTIARAKTGSYMRAAWAASSAAGRFDDLAADAEHPAHHDALMGQGLLHVVVGTLPGGRRRLLRFLGFEGSATEGRAELERAAAESELHQVPAGLLLALADLALFREAARARERLAVLHQERPQSLLVAHLYSLALLDDRRAAEAVRVLRAARRRAASDAYFYLDYLDFYLARALFRTDDFAGAARHYRHYLDRHEGPALKAAAHLHRGEALDLLGRRAAAERHYRAALDPSRDFDTDEAARRQAEKRLAAPPDVHARALLLGRTAYDSGRDVRADSLLAGVFRAPGATDAQRGEAAYRRGRVFHAREQWQRARQAYRFAAARPGDAQAKWQPWSHFYLGAVHEAEGRPARARAAYEKALTYEGFDYAESLEQSARAALEALE